MRETFIGMTIVALVCSQTLPGGSSADAQDLKIEKVGRIKSATILVSRRRAHVE
jgi:hypothetical protein